MESSKGKIYYLQFILDALKLSNFILFERC